MTVIPEPLPIESTHCRVRARISNIYADGPDGGTGPDWRAPTGEAVTLTPGVAGELLAYDVQGEEPRVVMVEKVECVVGEGGWLKTKADGQDVYIVPTDDPLLSATGWTWTATIRGKSIKFAAPSGGVVDLAMFVAAPAADDTKAWVERIPELVALLEASADPAVVAAAVQDYLADNPVGGLKVYTSWAEVDAETESGTGVLTTDDWEPAGLTHDGTRDGAFFITTQVQTVAQGSPGAGVWRRQELRMWDSALGAPIWRVRRTWNAGGPWPEWWDVEHWELPDALKASLAKAEDAVVELDTAAFDNPKAPYVVGYYTANWRTLTGFAELPKSSYVVAHVFHGGTPAGMYSGNWVQTVVVPLPDGTSRTISRVSTNGTSYGPWTLQGPRTGTGSPEGVVAAPVGTEYVDTAATNGAIKWIKATGTGNTGWRVLYGDTGVRDITLEAIAAAGSNPGLFNPSSTDWNTITARRVGERVTVRISYMWGATAGGVEVIAKLPHGFRPQGYRVLERPEQIGGDLSGWDYGFIYGPEEVEVGKAGNFEVSATCAASYYEGTFVYSYSTTDPWPTVLPGTPA